VSHREDVVVRYGEVDMQGVVFNAHYLAYVDHVMTGWLAACRWPYTESDWDFMVRRAEVVWDGSVGFGDVLTVTAEIAHWGTTSFRVHFALDCADRHVGDVALVYVGVDKATGTKAEVPAVFRDALGPVTVARRPTDPS
jgi:acyl-CoA thioester hydrolase